MSERYDSMRRLRDNIDRLFVLCGLEEEKIDIKMSPKLLVVAERLFHDNSVCEFLDLINQKTLLAIKALNNQHLDLWSAKETERLLEEAEERLIEEKSINDKKLNDLRKKLNSCEDSYKKELEKTIRNIIAMRDNLLISRDFIRENSSQDKTALKVVENQLKETGNILNKMGVEILENEGLFDSSKQTIVDTRTTNEPSLNNKIAEIFRPGYIYEDSIIRGQEVIVYIYEK